MKLILDTLGADRGPAEIIQGGLKVMEKHSIELILVGDESGMRQTCQTLGADLSRISFLNGPETIENTEEPAYAVRRKKNASIPVGLQALKDGLADGFLSAGSTGAILAGGLLITKRIDLIDRAALTIVLPSQNGGTVMLDVGANVDCTPKMLSQFALMGSIYAEKVLNRQRPKVALLNIGAEEGKGNELTKRSFPLLKEQKINFVGNIEPRDIISGQVDVIVSDGFVGNIALKAIEGVSMAIIKSIKSGINQSFRAKMGGLLLKPVLKNVKVMLDYREHGGAPMLGIRKPVFKAHGSSDARAIETGLEALIRFVENDVIADIEKEIQSVV